MAKVEGRESEALRGIASVSIAGELESRLRDLERNIAVAKQFIKLADESYSEVRREWNILQQDLGERTPETDFVKYSASLENRTTERVPRKGRTARKEKIGTRSDETVGKDAQTLTKIDSGMNRTKVTVPVKKETEDVPHNEDTTSFKKPFKRLRPRPKG